jgi:hypothetical protein
VAKKRRKQETGGAVNQMFAHCCGHATIVARRQPFFGFIVSDPRRPPRQGSIQRVRAPPRHNLRAIERKISPPPIRSASSRDKTDWPTHITENRKAQFESHPCSNRPFDRPACDACRKSQRLTSIVFDAIASFLCGRHFLRAFSSRDDAARDTRTDNGLIFHTQDRTTSCAFCRRRF